MKDEIFIPDGLSKKELFKFLSTNKHILIAQKKSAIKKGDAVHLSATIKMDPNDVNKAAGAGKSIDDATSLDIESVINTCNWMDSHDDVHIKGIWNKSVAENVLIYLCQEHSLTFKGIISDEVTASVRKISWRKLGVNKEGYTEALVFESKVEADRNSFMFDEYRKGRVKNHSVGMQYVCIYLCINDEDYKEYKAMWDKYYPVICNSEVADAKGYFWAVTEAKCIEGSAVPLGSNIVTPTLNISESKADDSTKEEPDNSTLKEPLKKKRFNFAPLIKN